jgi:CBS domain-containing protein
MVAIQVKDVMIKKVITYTKNDKVLEISQCMADHQISCVVITEKQKPIGLITERDIIKRIVSKNIIVDGLRAKDVMSSKLFTVDENENIFNIVKIMENNKIRRLPVVKNGKLVGLVTETDLVKAMTRVVTELNTKLVNFITHT